MGSTAKGLISGFICRLCSKMNRYVILIYSKEGERMHLADKINLYLPITVTRNDPLPKTICLNCIDRLEKHSQMIQTITQAENKFNNRKQMIENNRNTPSSSKGSNIQGIHFAVNNSDYGRSSINEESDEIYVESEEYGKKNLNNVSNNDYFETSSDSD